MKLETEFSGLAEVAALSFLGLIISAIVTFAEMSTNTGWVLAYLD
jgi:hypothetical protein